MIHVYTRAGEQALRNTSSPILLCRRASSTQQKQDSRMRGAGEQAQHCGRASKLSAPLPKNYRRASSALQDSRIRRRKRASSALQAGEQAQRRTPLQNQQASKLSAAAGLKNKQTQASKLSAAGGRASSAPHSSHWTGHSCHLLWKAFI